MRPRPGARNSLAGFVTGKLGMALVLFTLLEVNYPRLRPQSQLVIFTACGLILCFLNRPFLGTKTTGRPLAARIVDGLLIAATLGVSSYLVTQSQPLFRSWWARGQELGNRAGGETSLDLAVGLLGLILVLEGARRAVGWTLPLLATVFVLYARLGPHLPGWLLPHRGYDFDRIAAQTFLHGQGVFGIALSVMFSYVFLFVVFGAILEVTGATGFILKLAQRLLRRSTGGPAKVAVLASGLMGSLSGSAVANTATTGTFTIPLMRASGFRAHIAAGIEAAASSGGALMPPVMGAGAYMMLELVEPQVTYVAIMRAALIPALLYYLSLFLVVHFQARQSEATSTAGGNNTAHNRAHGERTGSPPDDPPDDLPDGKSESDTATPFSGLIFGLSLLTLIVLLVAHYSPFRAVSVALAVAVGLGFFAPRQPLNWRRLAAALSKAANDSIALICAAACVGILLGVVTLTGIGTQLPALVLPLAQDSLFLALLLIMGSTVILGMGLPSAVCYLLVATLIGPALSQLGVIPLAAHLFVFYFGLMSMVTPPVALAAYAAASIAGTSVLRTAVSAFRFALLGFVLPFLFIYRPALLALAPDGDAATSTAGLLRVATITAVTALAIVPLAAAVVGHLSTPLRHGTRLALILAGLLLLLPIGPELSTAVPLTAANLAGGALLATVAGLNRRRLSDGRQGAN